MKNFIVGFIIATIATGASYAAAFNFGWITEADWLEAASVFASYICTYLCVVESRWNYPVGFVATALLCTFFWQGQLYSSAALNFYLPIALLYGWWRWGPDRQTRPVTWLGKDKLWFAYAAWSIGVWLILYQISNYFNAPQALADSAILGLSVMAQLLLDNKRIETWAFWAAGNIIAIPHYWTSGYKILALQFVFFLANTCYGYYMWQKSMKKEPIVEFVGENVEATNA